MTNIGDLPGLYKKEEIILEESFKELPFVKLSEEFKDK